MLGFGTLVSGSEETHKTKPVITKVESSPLNEPKVT